ncbi:MAG: hypothetical protein HY872_09760 [Chloroflexi bacterium]|nr:hypothetical protein [Chloroflexota bacterium]
MNSNSRWQGLALLIGGILMGVGLLIHPNDAADPGAVLSARWALAHGLLLIGAVPVLLGLSSLYQRAGGGLAFIGYLLTFGGVALFIFAFALEAFVVPVMAADPNAQALLDPAGPLLGGSLGLFLLVTGLVFTVGAILLGIAILRSATLPKWSGVLFIIGSAVAFVPPLPYAVLIISGLALSAALIVTGYAIWSERMMMGKPAMA